MRYALEHRIKKLLASAKCFTTCSLETTLVVRKIRNASESPSPSRSDMYSFTVKEDFYIFEEVLQTKVLHDNSAPELANFEKILARLIEKGCFHPRSAPIPLLLQAHFWNAVNDFRACYSIGTMVGYDACSEEELKYIPLCLGSLKKIASSLRGEEHRSSTCNHPPPSAPDLVSHNRPHGSYPMHPYQPFYPHPSIYHQHYHHNYPPPPTYPHQSFYQNPPLYVETPPAHPIRSATAPAPSACVVPPSNYPFEAPCRGGSWPKLLKPGEDRIQALFESREMDGSISSTKQARP